jgi:hypothetical protein
MGRQNKIDAAVANLDKTGLFRSVAFQTIDRKRLVPLWMATRTPVEASFSVRGLIPIPGIAGVEEAYLTLIHAPEFVDRVLTDENERIRGMATVHRNLGHISFSDQNPCHQSRRTMATNYSIESRNTHFQAWILQSYKRNSSSSGESLF